MSHKSVSEQNISKNDNFKKAQKESKMGLKNLLVFIFEKSVNFYFDFAFKKAQFYTAGLRPRNYLIKITQPLLPYL